MCQDDMIKEPKCSSELIYSMDDDSKTNLELIQGFSNEIITRSDRENQISETNLRNLEQLKDYPYSTEIRQSSKSGKDFIMYICEFDGCKKEFLRTWNLLDHVRMHQGVKPYVCDYCPKTFTQRGNLKKHLTKHYNPSIESRRKFLCRFCSSKFTERYNYKTHLKRKHNLVNVSNKMLS